MRSSRVLAALLVVLVLVPAGILGWLGIRGTDRFAAEMRQRIAQEMDLVAAEAARVTPELAAEEAADANARVAAAADLLARRLPFDPVGRSLEEARALLRAGGGTAPVASTELDGLWRSADIGLRVLDATSRPVLPVPFEPDGAGRARSDADRLFDDLGRHADTAAFGRGDLPGAVEVWRTAATRFAEPASKARAEVEASLLTSALALPARSSDALVTDLEARFPAPVLAQVGRPWVLLLLRGSSPAGPSITRLRSLHVDGLLPEIPLTEQERARALELLEPERAPAAADTPDGGNDVHHAALPGGLALEVKRRWPSLQAGPAGILLERWRAQLPALARVELTTATVAPPASDRLGGVRISIPVPRPGGPPAWATLSHRDESRLLADVNTSRRFTIVGVVSLVGVIGLGMLVGRSALAREREARRLKDDFLANVSHELRTPLTSVCLHADLLAESSLPNAQRLAHAEVVRAEGARLSALVDDLLDFAALERGSRRLEPEPVDLGAAAARALAPFRVLADREGIALDLQLGPGELLALADPHALGRILSNLIGNAWKHGRPARDGGPGRLEVRVALVGGRPSVEVLDDGPGVPANERALLFERFRRGAAAGKTRGVGLGLALSRDLARAMGGDLAIVEDPTHTVFRLTLPPVPPEAGLEMST